MPAARLARLALVLCCLSAAALAQRAPERDFRANAGAVAAISVDPAGSTMVAAYPDERLRFWNLATGELLREVRLRVPRFGSGAQPLVAEARTEDLAFAPSGAFFAEVFVERPGGFSVRLWDPQTAAPTRTLASGLSGVRGIAISPDSARAAWGATRTSGADQEIILFDLESGRQQSLRTKGLFVSALCFSPDGKRLLSVGGSQGYLWDLDARKLIRTIKDHKSTLQTCAFAPDGAMFATADSKGVVMLWKLDADEMVHEIKTPHERVAALAFSASSRSIISGGADKGVRVWSTANGLLREGLFYHLNRVTDLALTHEGQTLLTSGADGRIALWKFLEAAGEPEPEEKDDDEEEERPAPPRRRP